MGLRPTPTWKTTLPKKVTAGHRGKFLSCSSLTLCQTRGGRSRVNYGSASGKGLEAQPPPWSPAGPHLNLPAGELLPNLTELQGELQSLSPHPAPDPARSPKVLLRPESLRAAQGPSDPLPPKQGHEGAEDPAATPTSLISSPGRGRPCPVPPLNQAGSSLGLTGLAHATGPHHGDLDEPAARSPQAAVGSSAARGGVLCDGTHVLDETHRRSGRAAPRREGS